MKLDEILASIVDFKTLVNEKYSQMMCRFAFALEFSIRDKIYSSLLIGFSS